MVVPGSGLVKKQAEDEGIDKVFKNAGFEKHHHIPNPFNLTLDREGKLGIFRYTSTF